MNSNTELIYILTYDCNFRCRYCDVGKRKEHMSEKVIKQSFDLIESLPENISLSKVKFFGGEPLLRKSEMKLILEGFPGKYHPRFFVTTNTSLLDDDFVKIAEKHELTITCSIDGDIATIAAGRSRDSLEIAEKVIEKVERYALQVRVNQVITSKNAQDFFANFRFIYDLGVRKFNFLPEYYSEWTREGLLNLRKGFDQILDFYKNGNQFELVNLENYSDISFFNLGLVIDTDGTIYGTNLILSSRFEKYKEDLKIGDIFSGITMDLQDRKISENYTNRIGSMVEKEYSKSVLQSVKYVDLLLNSFCNEIGKLNNQ